MLYFPVTWERVWEFIVLIRPLIAGAVGAAIAVLILHWWLI